MKPRSPDYAIGDVVAIPEDANLALALTVQYKRGKLTSNAKASNTNHYGNKARKILAGMAENERLRTDPFEQARTFLRRKGFVPVAKVDGEHHVGRRRFTTQAEVMAFAREKGWKG